MPIARCGLGFNCAAMQLTPGLDPADCPNYRTCGAAYTLTPDEQLELVRVREERDHELQQRWERRQETIRLNRRQAAVMMLLSRGRPQHPRDFGTGELLAAVSEHLADLRTGLQLFEGDNCYIAPPACEVHRYLVKRPGRAYEYNKLDAHEPVFRAAAGTDPVRNIHLSRDDDPRNLEARDGIERRNALELIATQLRIATAALQRATQIAHTAPTPPPAVATGEGAPEPDRAWFAWFWFALLLIRN